MNVKTLLFAEDDPDDIYLVKEASKIAEIPHTLKFVGNGQELMDYLNRQSPFHDIHDSPFPHVIVLDLNMPLIDGREALKNIKSNERFNHIPIVILTTSSSDEDIVRSYDQGANSFITKPQSFDELVKILTEIDRYWFDVVELPN